MQEQRPTPGEKGLALEQRIARLFQARGYHVSHDVRLTGRSGVQHQVDVLARFTAPLHSSTIVIEAKAYERPVDKDRIMKLIQVVEDLGCDRGILVTTNAFTPDALKTARGRNIDIWDRDHLARLVGELEVAGVEGRRPRAMQVLERAVPARIDERAVRERLQRDVRKRRRGFLGIGRIAEEMAELHRIDYPYYDADLEVRVTGDEKVGLFRKETVTRTVTTRVTFDATTGALVYATGRGIAYDHAWLHALSPEEAQLLRDAPVPPITNASLATMGLSETRARRIVSALLARGALRQTATRPAAYTPVHPFPRDPLALPALSDAHPVLQDAAIGGETVAPPRVEAGAVIRAVESYWDGARATSVCLVYYPYLLAEYRRPDGSTRADAIDAVTGASCPAVAESLRARAG
ncbi:MAG TPA: restriction endonuclease [Dehalococcoidia bacterium]|nr:restriction endonuclease [Dehalococcoidia bacterium]